jgi:hypothetical protein
MCRNESSTDPQCEPFEALQRIPWPSLVHGKHADLNLIESIDGLDVIRKFIARRPVAQPKPEGGGPQQQCSMTIEGTGAVLYPVNADQEASVLEQFGQTRHYTHAPPSLVIDHNQ